MNLSNKWREWLMAICLGIFYLGVINRIPISYWDEMIWVGRSYFVDFYIKGDFDSRIWQTNESYDQPKLGEYAYGLWIYPKYLYEKTFSNADNLDFQSYLINHGLYFIDESFVDKYKDYFLKKLPDIVIVNATENGDRNYYLQTYGQKVLPTLDLVAYARIINILWLVLAVVAVFSLTAGELGRGLGDDDGYFLRN